jgi:hypothetical protein
MIRLVLSFQPENTRARDLLRIIEVRGTGDETSVGEAERAPAATVAVSLPPTPDRATATVLEEKAPAPPPPHPPPGREFPKFAASRGVLAGVAAAVVAVLVAVYFLFLRGPSVPTGSIALNIVPWAEVVKIERTGSGPFALQEKSVTPCLLELPEGSYTITLANPSLQTPLQVTITVKAGELQEVRRKIPGFDYQSILSTF